MKFLPAFLATLFAGLVAGCAIAEKDADDVGQQFQDGLSGRGEIFTYDPTRDSFGPEYN